jgi:1,3,6,8-tetrahydroxynaphthalene synthase
MMPGATGVIAGFGPGITAEMAVGSWTVDTPSEVDRIRRGASASHLERQFAQTAGRQATWTA